LASPRTGNIIPKARLRVGVQVIREGAIPTLLRAERKKKVYNRRHTINGEGRPNNNYTSRKGMSEGREIILG